MIDRILISVIIPSYNRANTVGETIESIVNQQVNADIEIVIGDDCSTDNAREVLLQYKEKYPTYTKETTIVPQFVGSDKNNLTMEWVTAVKENGESFSTSSVWYPEP